MLSIEGVQLYRLFLPGSGGRAGATWVSWSALCGVYEAYEEVCAVCVLRGCATPSARTEAPPQGRPQGIAPTHQLQPHLPRLTARVVPTLPRISLPSQWRVLGWHGNPWINSEVGAHGRPQGIAPTIHGLAK